jgi:uncharacterized protein YdcH (DUF465 family)
LSNTPHTLGDEFPEQMDAIHALKAKNPEFAHVLTEYDEVNDRIHRAETRLDAISEEAEATLRRAPRAEGQDCGRARKYVTAMVWSPLWPHSLTCGAGEGGDAILPGKCRGRWTSQSTTAAI